MNELELGYVSDLKPIKLNESQQNELICSAIKKREDWMTMSRPYRQEALRVRQLYQENRPYGQDFENDEVANDSKSNVRMPLMAQCVDSTLAQQHRGTFPTDEDFFTSHAMNELSKENQIAYEDSTEQRLKLINFLHKSKMDRMNAMLDGVSAVWHPYVRKTRQRAVYTQKRNWLGIPQRSLTKEYVDEVMLEGTDFVPINLEDWWIDPTIDDFDDCNFIWRRWVDVNYIKSIKEYKNTKDVTEFNVVYDDSTSRLQQNYRQMGLMPVLNGQEEKMGKDAAMLFEEWGDFWIDEKLYENCVLIYSNECNFHGFFKNPFDHGYKPFSLCPYIPFPGTLFGHSLGKPIVPLVHAYDAFFNSAIDIVNVSAGAVWKYLSTDHALLELFAEGEVIIEPGRAYPVQNMDNLQKETGDLSHLGVIDTFMQRIKEVAQESTGGVNYATGGIQQLGQDRTATEVNTLASGTSTRYQDLIQSYEENKLKRFLWMWFENDRQFLSDVLKTEDAELDPKTVKQMDFEFEVMGSKTSMSQSKEASALLGIVNMLPKLFQLPTFKPKQDVTEVDINGMIQQIGRAQGARNINDYMKVVVTAEEVQQQQPSPLEAMLNGYQQNPAGGSPVDLAAAIGQSSVVPPMPGAA